MKPRNCLANALVALVPALSILMVGCKGETPSAPSTTYTLRASAGENGTISPVGDYQVRQGGTLTYSIASASGYVIADVLVDGVTVGAVKSYTFTDVTTSHMIAATFKEAPPVNLVANSGMETVDPDDATKPLGWVLAGWGTNTFTSTWLTSGGHNSDHALEINISARTDGSREWYFKPIAVDPGKKYDISIWYKGSVAMAPGILWLAGGDAGVASNNYTGVWLTAGTATDEWAEWKYTTDVAPDKTAATGDPVDSMTVLPIINSVGTLIIDDVSVMEHVEE
jgi:hypothetical protein